MNVIVLGKSHNGAIHVVEHEDDEGYFYAVKYGDWDGFGSIDWWQFNGVFERHNFSSSDFELTDYPLVPVAYNNQYALVCLVNDYELGDNERLVKVGPASPKLVVDTINDMWGK